MLNIDFERNHFLFLIDGTKNCLVERIIRKLKERVKTFRYVAIKKGQGLEELLAEQPVGTVLVIAAAPDVTARLVHSARETGYPEADILTVRDESQNVFCGSCHHLSKTVQPRDFTCPNCGCELEVSDHYSAYYDAVLGYPTIRKVDRRHG